MSWERLYRVLQPESAGTAARVFRIVHHAMVILGIAIMLADTVAAWRQAYHGLLDAGFQIACAFFFAEYVLRLAAAPGAPAAHRRGWRARLAWALSIGGVFDMLGALPGVLDVAFRPEIRQPLRLRLGVQAGPLCAGAGQPAAGDQPRPTRAALGPPRFRDRPARRRQPRLSARARRPARAVRLDPVGAVVGDRDFDDDRLWRCDADHPARADSRRVRHGFAAFWCSRCGPASWPPAMPKSCAGANSCAPGIWSPRCRSSTASAPRSSPMWRACCGRETIRRGRPSCAAASAATACTSSPRARSRCGCRRERFGWRRGNFSVRSRC